MVSKQSGSRQPWWRGAIIYQIYVRSWRDSNGDGVGDLPGVIDCLDYLQWTGVDAIWLSPTMPSPNTDYGYDVADYLGVHPELGTLDDLDRLVREADRRDIAVMLDLVPNHTSDQHPWFLDARSAKDSAHRDYYVWAPPKDGGPPNNWIDATGKEAWALDEASGEYYLHNFLPTQPDLNWWDGRVHAEFEDI
jgi:alpha-glucosidase